MDITCGKCGGGSLVSGSIFPDTLVGFRPNDIKFASMKRKLVLDAIICGDCGYVELKCDVEKLKKMISNS